MLIASAADTKQASKHARWARNQSSKYLSTRDTRAPVDLPIMAGTTSEIWGDSDKEFFDVMVGEGFSETAGCLDEIADMRDFMGVVSENFKKWMSGIMSAKLERKPIPEVEHEFYEECVKIVDYWAGGACTSGGSCAGCDDCYGAHHYIIERAGKDAYYKQFMVLLDEILQPEIDAIMKCNVAFWESNPHEFSMEAVTLSS